MTADDTAELRGQIAALRLELRAGFAALHRRFDRLVPPPAEAPVDALEVTP